MQLNRIDYVQLNINVIYLLLIKQFANLIIYLFIVNINFLSLCQFNIKNKSYFINHCQSYFINCFSKTHPTLSDFNAFKRKIKSQRNILYSLMLFIFVN